MSDLYGDIEGERGTATKAGSGFLRAHIRGWRKGVIVRATHDKDGGDTFQVCETGGSLGVGAERLIAVITDEPAPKRKGKKT